jgi:hypothetical protein
MASGPMMIPPDRGDDNTTWRRNIDDGERRTGRDGAHQADYSWGDSPLLGHSKMGIDDQPPCLTHGEDDDDDNCCDIGVPEKGWRISPCSRCRNAGERVRP